jgi:hypothetical protein
MDFAQYRKLVEKNMIFPHEAEHARTELDYELSNV